MSDLLGTPALKATGESLEAQSKTAELLQQASQSVEQWDTGFNDWMKTISADLALKSREIEALTISAQLGGWLSDGEASELFKLASWVPEENAVCCEIGSWLCKSSVILGKALTLKQNAKLYCVDPFDLLMGDAWHQEAFHKQVGQTTLTRKQYVDKTISDSNLNEVVTLVEDFSEKFIHKFDQELDLLFIDADHAYESVLQDYQNWAPLVKSGGFIAFHDYHRIGGAHAGPRRVIHEHVVGNPDWPKQWIVDTLYVAQKA